MDAIRNTLQPITQNLPIPLREVGEELLGRDCYKKLIINIDPVAHPDCVKLALSKGLGIGIVGASAIVKLPQLLKLISSQSAEGVSFLSYLLETAAYVITLAYNARMGNPFSTYGESALIAVQNVAIASLVLHYGGKSAGAGVFIAGLAAGVYALFNVDLVDMKTMTMLQAGAGVLGVASKLPQILTIWQKGGTGQLSAFTVFNFLFGSLTRIFTTIQEVDDPLILYGFVAGFALNLVLALQMLWYWNEPTGKKLTKKTPEIRVQGEKGEQQPVAFSTGAAPKGRGPTTRRKA